jgi:hypothetical protein
MNILLKTKAYFNKHVLSAVKKKHQELFQFGFQAFCLQPFTSLNSNARTVVANRSTAESKLHRLFVNESVRGYFSHLVSRLGLVSSTDILIVDISTFCGFNVLTFAKQTWCGRAMPVYFALIRYPITEPTSQNNLIIAHIKKLKDIVGFYPSLVCDRGFMLPTLIEFLVKEEIVFYIRMKQDKHVVYGEMELSLFALGEVERDAVVTVYGVTLRVVTSYNTGEYEEPWYILTSDMISSHAHIIAVYYFRFEIEETFKDLKHVFNLKRFFITKEQSFATLLWFYILAVWIAFILQSTQKADFLCQKTTVPKHKQLSILRLFHEAIQRSLLQLALKTSIPIAS